MGVRKFNEAKEASVRRTNRSVRRTLRRKKWRKEQLLNAFVEFKLLEEEIRNSGLEHNSKLDHYLSFSNKKTIKNQMLIQYII